MEDEEDEENGEDGEDGEDELEGSEIEIEDEGEDD